MIAKGDMGLKHPVKQDENRAYSNCRKQEAR